MAWLKAPLECMTRVSSLPTEVACHSIQPQKLIGPHGSSERQPPMDRPKLQGDSHPDKFWRDSPVLLQRVHSSALLHSACSSSAKSDLQQSYNVLRSQLGPASHSSCPAAPWTGAQMIVGQRLRQWWGEGGPVPLGRFAPSCTNMRPPRAKTLSALPPRLPDQGLPLIITFL